MVSAQQESVIYSQYLIKSNNSGDFQQQTPMSTGNLLEQAYARSCLEKPRQMILSTQKQNNKPSGPRKPEEVMKKLRDR